MNLISISGNGSFKLVDEHKEVVKLKYTNWFLGKAETYLDHQKIEIKPKGLFNSSADIKRHGRKIGDISMSWKGKMKIQFENQEGVKFIFSLNRTGVWKSDFTVKDDKGNPVLNFIANRNWRKIKTDYQIDILQSLESVDIHELLLYCGYAINLHIALSSAA
ncbi:hypothetical protein FHS59_001272 [Algoriphagus iocasae]|uniref:Uncharacterized protein n=1 Tax=Algoriphagus iocasae TaxID=1836499 RepID=A0A841MJM2_9BACT|nr:aminotransferase [Algoriphagus iocasae]MBB6325657.1 hypothetical protein [Algoriphagus iocasae]